jgi:hypothetical protein
MGDTPHLNLLSSQRPHPHMPYWAVEYEFQEDINIQSIVAQTTKFIRGAVKSHKSSFIIYSPQDPFLKDHASKSFLSVYEFPANFNNVLVYIISILLMELLSPREWSINYSSHF